MDCTSGLEVCGVDLRIYYFEIVDVWNFGSGKLF